MRARSQNPEVAAVVDTHSAMQVAAFRADLRTFLRTSERLARRERGHLTPQRHLLLLMIKGDARRERASDRDRPLSAACSWHEAEHRHRTGTAG